VPRAVHVLVLIAAFAAIAVIIAARRAPALDAADGPRPTYVGSEACGTCHVD